MKATEEKRPTIQIEYDAEKLEAIRFYLRDRNTTVERELSEALDGLFKKNVPVAVREYIERRNLPIPDTTEQSITK